MAYEFPTENLVPGQIEEVPQADGSVIRYQWTDPPGVWKILSTGGGGDGITGPITTADVLTMGARPTSVSNPFDDTPDLLQTQQNANWYLWDAIEQLEAGNVTVWIGSDPPPNTPETIYMFWFDETNLELLILYNGQYFPVSIPPAKLQAVSEIIEGLEVSVTQVRGDIALNKIDIDENMLDLTVRIDGVEETANTAKDTADDAKAAADAATNSIENAAFVNQSNTFDKTNTFEGNLESDKQLTIVAPSSTNTNPTFQIKGTSKTGTINSVVFNATQSGSRMRVTYKGPIDSDDEITTKKYVDNAIGPAFHKWIFKPDTDKMDLNPGEFTGPKQPTYGNGTHYSYYFHTKSLTGEMEFYKDYDMYFPMNSLWGAFHYLNGSKWRLKHYVPVRNIKMFRDDNYLEIYTHTSYPTGGEIIAAFDPDTEYYFAIGGMI